ncbi:tRNA (adenosine(37)-N6)-threonylcarbamoyltransferase complex dimerization subunit type 1 TsaB [Sphingomonas lacunae]|uniref:tRNA (adenosine(37)-N6)-threonylcarbamoyltransferase complex dimerization subunit type 1 TsaB n=1 Tax=Sphingomonas lacunae TaxID=2698828 RepID=UPI0024837C42|nr:tRNA (adenosine(37)-N6)-threonylcarbamoyltransferase complex dimerization subunit type 1 TsaB [Sphingomonas lacunae]
MIDTCTPHLSVALFDGEQLIGHRHVLIGRGHAEQLLPTISDLPDGGRATAICVGCGPGSFTGQRIGIAAAKALAFGWGADLKGFNTLSLVAAHGRSLSGADQLAVVIDGGHGEWLVAGGQAMNDPVVVNSCTPDAAVSCITDQHVAGQRAVDFVSLRGFGQAWPAEADARLFPFLGPKEIFGDLRPLYARPPDAKVAA